MRKNNLSGESIIRYVEEIIGESLHAKQVESIGNAVIGVIRGVDLRVQSIGHAMAAELDKESKHAIKQIDRYLSNEAIEVGKFFEQWIKYQVRGMKELVVAMDWTEFERDKQSTISIHMISTHSRAMPLVWKSVEKEKLQDKRNDYEDEVIEILRKNISEGVKVTLLADRGFADTKLMHYLQAIGFDYVIRIKKNFHIKNVMGEDRIAKQWLVQARKIKLKQALITAQDYRVESFVAVKEKMMKEAWFLVSSLALPASKLIKLYSKRFTIEESYRDFKDDRFGLGMAATHIKQPRRRDRLLIAAAIANMLLTILGAAGEDLGHDRLLKANTVKKRTHSLFRQGVLYFAKLPNMRAERKIPLLNRFAELLSMHQLFAFHLS